MRFARGGYAESFNVIHLCVILCVLCVEISF